MANEDLPKPGGNLLDAVAYRLRHLRYQRLIKHSTWIGAVMLLVVTIGLISLSPLDKSRMEPPAKLEWVIRIAGDKHRLISPEEFRVVEVKGLSAGENYKVLIYRTDTEAVLIKLTN